jgi:hypothetical protein
VDYACTAVGLRLTYCSSLPCTVGTTNRRTSGGKLALRACEGLGYIGPGIIAPVAELAHESKDRAPPFPFWYLNLLRPGIQTSPGHSKCKYSHLRPARVDGAESAVYPTTTRRRTSHSRKCRRHGASSCLRPQCDPLRRPRFAAPPLGITHRRRQRLPRVLGEQQQQHRGSKIGS